jgi:hypothetical protein
MFVLRLEAVMWGTRCTGKTGNSWGQVFTHAALVLTDPPVHLVLLVHLVPPLLNEKDGIRGRRMSGGD